MSTPRWITDLGLEDPSIDEFLHRPDLRQISSFFLGILFTAAIYYFFHSPTLRSVRDRITSRRPSRTSVEAIYMDQASKSTFSSLDTRLDPLALVFILNLVYITTPATQFASLLAFSSTKGQVPCTFFVAWATLGGETIRLIAFLKLSFHLYELRPSRFERAMLWSTLALLAVIMFLNTAVATGVLRNMPQVESFALCYKRHFTLGAAIISGVNVILEFYFLIRIIFLLLPWSAISGSHTLLFKDIRIRRALSLVILDGATVYPSLFPTSLVADFAPFAMASILVLMAFNHNPPSRPSPSPVSVINIAPPSLRTLPQSIRIPTPNFSPFLNMESSVSASKERSIADIPPETGSVISIATRGSQANKTVQHPFAAAGLAENRAPNNRPPRRVLLRARSMPSDDPSSLANGGSRTRSNLFNSQNVQRRVTAYEALLRGPEENMAGLENSGHQQDSFLPSIPTTPQEMMESSARAPQRPQRTRSSNVRGPRQILPRQTEVADRMIARPQFPRPSHQAVTSLSSIQSSDNPAVTSPPAPPRVQRLVTQTSHQILVSTEDPLPVTPRSSSPDSTKLFGSDILLRSREDIMRNPPPASSEDIKSEGPFLPERERVTSQSTASVNRRDSSHVSITGGRPRTADSARPTTADSMQSDSVSIPREPSTSTGRLSGGVLLPKRALNALKRPTFGETSFERFKSGLASFTEVGPSNSTKDDDSPTRSSPRDERRPRTSGSSSRLPPATEHSGSKGGSSRGQSQQGTGI